jgi:hypothetical protein
MVAAVSLCQRCPHLSGTRQPAAKGRPPKKRRRPDLGVNSIHLIAAKGEVAAMSAATPGAGADAGLTPVYERALSLSRRFCRRARSKRLRSRRGGSCAQPPRYPPRSAEEVYAWTLLGAPGCFQDVLTCHPYEDRHMDAVMKARSSASICRSEQNRNRPALEGWVSARSSSPLCRPPPSRNARSIRSGT